MCNLASIALNRYVTADRKFDFKQLEYVTGVIVRNLNKIIEINYYPVKEVNLSHAVIFFWQPVLPDDSFEIDDEKVKFGRDIIIWHSSVSLPCW